MSNRVDVYFDESGRSSAQIMDNNGVYEIHYTDSGGRVYHVENFQGKSIHYVKDAAENWARGIKTLNG